MTTAVASDGKAVEFRYPDIKETAVTSSEDFQTLVPDIEVFGNPDTFQLICKASSRRQGWMKSTKALEIPGSGCLVQVTTQQGDQVAEALTFVPGIRIGKTADGLPVLESVPAPGNEEETGHHTCPKPYKGLFSN